MLNREHFVLLAGNPKDWDDEMIRRTQGRNGQSLVEVQRDQHARGRLSAKLLNLPSGWAVMDNSGLGGDPFFQKGFKTKDAAIMWGKTWANGDPTMREFIASRRDMEG